MIPKLRAERKYPHFANQQIFIENCSICMLVSSHLLTQIIHDFCLNWTKMRKKNIYAICIWITLVCLDINQFYRDTSIEPWNGDREVKYHSSPIQTQKKNNRAQIYSPFSLSLSITLAGSDIEYLIASISESNSPENSLDSFILSCLKYIYNKTLAVDTAQNKWRRVTTKKNSHTLKWHWIWARGIWAAVWRRVAVWGKLESG